jgi:hypothetical protein
MGVHPIMTRDASRLIRVLSFQAETLPTSRDKDLSRYAIASSAAKLGPAYGGGRPFKQKEKALHYRKGRLFRGCASS